MSSSGPGEASTPAEGKDKRQRFERVLSRVKTVLKRGESSMSSKRQSQSVPSSQQPEAFEKPVQATKKSEPTAADKTTANRAKYENMAGVTKMSRSQLLEERAKKLGERFGLELTATDYQPKATSTADDTVLRMDKSIRMRVRRSCHKCDTVFTQAKECPSCQHVRCSQCVRHPPKRTEAELQASRERRAAILKANKENAPIIPDWDYEYNAKDFVLTRPRKTVPGELVHRKPRQRVRRNCHECQTLFAVGVKVCQNCEHVRCTDCPRDPAKKDKYPFGYPGDEFGPYSIPHYECTKCKSIYPTGAEDGVECKKCGNPKSDDSPRAKPRKVEPEPDPEIMKKINEKLEALRVSA